MGRRVVENAAVAEDVGRQIAKGLLDPVAAEDRERTGQTREVEGLRRRRERDRALGKLGSEAGERKMPMPRKRQVGMDLVRDDDPVVLQRQLAEGGELRAFEDTPAGVVRIAEQEQPCAGIDVRSKLIEVDLEAIRSSQQRVLDQAPTTAQDSSQEGRVDRYLDDDPVFRSAVQQHRSVEPLDDVYQGNDSRWLDLPGEPLGHARNQSVTQTR